MNAKCFSDNLKGRDHLEELGIKGEVKVDLSLYFNRALRHEGILRERRYSSTHS
jgi:hypothetical protein